MADIFDELDEQPKKRTTFIKVLCILTFIGSSYGLLSGTYSYFTAEKTARDAQEAANVFNTKKQPTNNADKKGEAIAKNILNTMADAFTTENVRKLSISEIIGALLCLAGALLMWQINKKGYILYVAGVLLGIIIPFILFGNNIMGIIMSVISGFVGLVFCILYGVNLKDMK
jgi:uncharacterized membrane protein